MVECFREDQRIAERVLDFEAPDSIFRVEERESNHLGLEARRGDGRDHADNGQEEGYVLLKGEATVIHHTIIAVHESCRSLIGSVVSSYCISTSPEISDFWLAARRSLATVSEVSNTGEKLQPTL
jgi:hypothetical protein